MTYDIYVELILKNKMKIDDVPAKWKAAVTTAVAAKNKAK